MVGDEAGRPPVRARYREQATADEALARRKRIERGPETRHGVPWQPLDAGGRRRRGARAEEESAKAGLDAILEGSGAFVQLTKSHYLTYCKKRNIGFDLIE
jgi:hypothetical protein